MIGTILSYVAVAVLGAVVGIFIYRNNVDLIGKKADAVDAIWDRLNLTEKFDEIGDKINELSDKIEEKVK